MASSNVLERVRLAMKNESVESLNLLYQTILEKISVLKFLSVWEQKKKKKKKTFYFLMSNYTI